MSEQKEFDDLQFILEAWKKTIDVQQHFNDLELRIRNFAVTALVAIFGVAGVAIQNKIAVKFFNINTSLASWLFLAGLIGWLAFYYMDRFWYHRLLVGAVKHGEAIEDSVLNLQGLDPITAKSIELTKAISKASPHKFFRMSIHSSTKINIFYLTVSVLFVIAFWAVH